MTTLRLGVFENFKFGDAVLLDGSREDIEMLSARLRDFAASSVTELPIHDFASVASSKPAQLSATKFDRHNGVGFFWYCGSGEIVAILEKLDSLVASGSGHQYFDLSHSPVQLVVSVGEYGESWWRQHG